MFTKILKKEYIMIKEKTHIIVVALAVTLLLILVGVLVTKIVQYNRMEAEKAEFIKEIELLKDDYERLKDTKEYMQRVEYAEKRARELGLIKEGETIWKLIEP